MNSNRAGKSGYRESRIVQRVRASLGAWSIERPHILLACSGGKDSVGLASVLDQLKRLDLISLSLAHIHHGQHDEADAAATAVQDIASTLGVPVVVRNLDRSGIDAHSSVGKEEAMRRERYRALAEIAAEVGSDAIALAHHQTDQAETVLLHLLRGSGIRGLGGMRVWEQRSIPWWESAAGREIVLWRPFIHESVEDIAAIALASELPIVEDPTNTDTLYRRNAIRHRLLPVIEEISPGSTSAVARSAHVIAPDADLLDELTAQQLAVCMQGNGLALNRLLLLSAALQRRVVRAWVLQTFPNLEIPFERIAAVLEMAHRNRGGSRVELVGGHSVMLAGGLLTFHPWQNEGG